MLYRALAALAGRMVLAASLALPWLALAQSYPDRPVKVILPAPPGGGIDAIARQVAEPLALALKQPVVLDNRAGAGGVIAGQAVARATPDGYTLLLIHSGHAVNPWTVKALPYDTLKDFAAVAKLGTAPLLLIASAQTGVRNMAELLVYARNNPDKMTFASTEITSRLASEQVLKVAGVKGVVANYRGLGAALTDASGGSVNFVFATISAALPLKDTGKLNFIGLAAPKRSPFLPNVPTLAEQGHPFDVQTWYGLAAPAGTPQDVLDRLGRELGQIVRNPEFESKLRTVAIQPDFATGRELDALIRTEITRWGDMIKAAGIQPE